MRITYWLYFNGRPIDSVRGAGLTDREARRLAIARNRRTPLVRHGVDPFEHEGRLRQAEVRTFREAWRHL